MKKVIIPAILALGLFVGSCNTDTQTKQHSVRSNDNKTEIRDKKETDSTSMKRDQTIKYDDQGNVIKEEKTEKRTKDQNQ